MKQKKSYSERKVKFRGRNTKTRVEAKKLTPAGVKEGKDMSAREENIHTDPDSGGKQLSTFTQVLYLSTVLRYFTLLVHYMSISV